MKHLVSAGLLLLVVTHAFAAPDAETLKAGFQSPPAEARPTTWWRFMDDYATEEGIKADLEFMRRIGLSGAVVSYCSSRSKLVDPKPGMPVVPMLSDAWWKMVGFQLDEAKKNDLSLWFQVCPGYATAGGPWITPEHSMQKLIWSTTKVAGGASGDVVLPAPTVDKKWNFYRDVAVLAYPSGDGSAPVPADKILELTDRLDADGKLAWHPPAGGEWTIVRFGHTTTGIPVHPAPKGGAGLECDKMSREAARIQFDSYFKEILAQRPASDRGNVQLFYDSWEAGNQNWTAAFREEFRKRRGYDLVPWILVSTGRLVGSEDLSRRFDHDWRTTIEEMINSEHFAELARLSHESGAKEFRAQPYNGPVNFMTAGALFDIPEGEFWHVNRNYGWWTLRMIASVAHVNGKAVASAESLTASPQHIRFDKDPFATKAETDLAFTMGINEMALHVQPHNPWPNLRPGMIAGPYGPILSRGQAWADLAGSWVDYLSRCCYLLRQGTFVADVVTLFRPGLRGFEPPDGYAGDICNEELIISSMSYDGSALTLPGGMRYRVLELVDTTAVTAPHLSPSGVAIWYNHVPLPQRMSLPLLRKIRELVLAGATIVGPRPVIAPGLAGYPESDKEIARIADELWGPATAAGPVERTVGKGRVFSGLSVAEVLSKTGVAPDFQTVEKLPADVVPWIHRRVGGDDWYFVSNQKSEPLTVTASFRVDGKVPELWQADTGTVAPPRAWSRKDGRTEVTLEFAPRGSVFVRFRPGPEAPATVPAQQTVRTLPISDGWKVRFSPEMGGPAEIDFPQLVSWTDRPEKGIRYYSGIATYERDVTVPPDAIVPGGRLVLDLGEVKNLARVTVNGTTFPELWKPPFTLDVTSALKAGPNRLKIEVVNVWANRLVGDEQEPADITWAPVAIWGGKIRAGQSLAAYPDWVINGTPRPSSERRTFTTWNFIEKDQPLIPAGLLGPVEIRSIVTPRQ